MYRNDLQFKKEKRNYKSTFMNVHNLDCVDFAH